MVFPTLVICALLLAGYWYVTNHSIIQPNDLSTSPSVQSTLGLTFTHPVYGYYLNLPFWWRDRYQVAEQGSSTNFYYQPHLNASANLPVRLFSILTLGKNYHDLNGEKISEQGEKSFWLETAKDTPPLDEEDRTNWRKMINDLPAITQSFKMVRPEQETSLKEFMIKELNLNGTTTLPVLAYETLATQETGSSTKIYLWLKTSQYFWQGNDLIKTDKIDLPLVVLWQKTEQTGLLKDLVVPRSGRYYLSDIRKMFPASITQNPIFKDKTPEHDDMLQKISADLDSSTLAYFGGSPVLTKYAWIRKFNEDNSNLVVTVNEAKAELLPLPTLATSGSRTIKCSPMVVACEQNGYLVRSSDKTSYRYLVSSSTKVEINSTTTSLSEVNSGLVPLTDFIAAFRVTSPSLWKNQIFKLSLLDDVVNKIEVLR